MDWGWCQVFVFQLCTWIFYNGACLKVTVPPVNFVGIPHAPTLVIYLYQHTITHNIKINKKINTPITYKPWHTRTYSPTCTHTSPVRHYRVVRAYFTLVYSHGSVYVYCANQKAVTEYIFLKTQKF